MTLHLHVDIDTCQGHGLCVFDNAELFDQRETDGKSVVLLDPVPERLAEAARHSPDVCPERAITLIED